MIESDRPMREFSQSSLAEPLRAKLSDADDRIRLNHWMPPQQGIAPRVRIGRRWINTLWGLPIAAAALLCLIAFAQSMREVPGVEALIQQHPDAAANVDIPKSEIGAPPVNKRPRVTPSPLGRSIA
jgi:methionine sulfoxide reductase catalytic subunit